MKNFKFGFIAFVSAFFVLNFLGCAKLKETAKCTWGVSTQLLEGNRQNAIRKTFAYDEKSCYERVRTALSHSTSYIYAQDPKEGLIAIYVSETDTTPVGIFCKGIDANNTQVEVVSPSTWARETISHRVFTALESSSFPDFEKGPQDAEKKVGDQ